MILTGWIIAGGIILFIIVLLAIPVVIRFEYGEQLYLKARYLFITLYRIPAKPKKSKKRKKDKKQSKPDNKQSTDVGKAAVSDEKTSAESKPAEKPEKDKNQKKEKNPKIPTLQEIYELVKTFVDSLSKPLKKLLRRIKILHFELAMICGGEDAAKAALNFGTMNLVVGNALGHFGSWFTLKDPHIDINVDFQSEETKTECRCTVKLSALVLLIFVFNFVGRLIWRVLKNKVIRGYLGRLTAKTEKKKKAKKK